MAQQTQPLPSGQSATPPVVRPRSIWMSWRFWVILVVCIAIYAYGTRLIGVNMVDLVKNAPNAQHIVTQLVQPNFFTTEKEIVQDSISVVIPGESVEPTVPTRSPKPGPQITLSNRVVKQGDSIEVSGTGWPANAQGKIVWDTGPNQTPIGETTTDAQGGFTVTVAVPTAEGQGVRFIDVTFESAKAGPFGLPAIALTEQAHLVLIAMWDTILMALIGTIWTVIIAAPLSFLAARNVMSGSKFTEAIYWIVRTTFNILRSIEVLIVAVIAAVVVGIGSYAGVLAITIHGVGALGKLYSEAIEGIDEGPIEALRATGANRLQTTLYAMLPQVIPAFISFTFYRWDINVRMATVVGLVGGGGIGFLLIQYMNLLLWRDAAVAIWAIVVVVMTMDWLSGWVRRKVM
ncbi:MAG: phosphonate ABC transporter, permease protein PhnE [Anaerolineae bacterium]